jgi:elongation factor Ts
MKISTEAIKKVRERTSAGMLDCKHALLKAGGDAERAVEALKSRGFAIAEKKGERIASEGVIDAYIHHNRKLGALIELNCETDFVAHTDEFRQLAYDLAMQVAATSPQFITAEEMPAESGLDPKVVCLLQQPFIKDPDRTVGEIVADTIARVGENIKVRRFARFEPGC